MHIRDAKGSPVQLVEAVILLFAGLVPGVWATLVDVYTLGATAFPTRIALLLLVVVLLSCNMRHRRQAAWGSAWLSLGCVESYYLSSAYTFEGMSRSAVVPLALLSVAAAGVSWVSWTAKHERGSFGLALKALVIVGTLVACVATHDGLSALDAVCTVGIAYCLFFMRSRRVAIERHDPSLDVRAEGDVAPATGESAPARRRRASSRGDGRPQRRASSEEALLSLAGRLLSPGKTARDADDSHAAHPARGRGVERRHPSQGTGSSERRSRSVSERSARRSTHPVTTLQLQRRAQPAASRSTSAGGGRRSASVEADRKGSAGSRVAGGRSAACKAAPSEPGSRQASGARGASGSGHQTGRAAARSSARGSAHGSSRRYGASAANAGKGDSRTGDATRQPTSARSSQPKPAKPKKAQRPTKRTGGAVPEANRMRTSSADGRGRAGARPHRHTESGHRSHR